MRKLRIAATGMFVVLTLTGCANMRDREWGSCAVAGGLIGATIGGVTGGVTVNNVADDPDNAKRGGAIAGGAVAGGALGALLGHLICDPEKTAPAPPPPPPPAPKKIETLQGPHFDFNKAELRPTGKEKLDRVAKTVQENPEMRLSCEGYTDSIGSDAYNLKLSERRANAARDYLISKGVSPSRVTAVGHGESNPVASNATEEGRAQNRRVEIIAR